MALSPASGHPPRSVIAELGTDSSTAPGVLRALRDSGHEVVYAGVLPVDGPELDRRLASVCVQEDADALVLFGAVPPGLVESVRERLAEVDDAEIVLLVEGPGLKERIEEHAARRS